MMDSTMETKDRSAQVCDQCRKRKVKCDGILPACSSCANAETTCTFSVQLRRKTKRRGHDPKDQTIQNLQAQVAELREQLKAQPQATQAASPNLDGGQSLVAGDGQSNPPLAKYQPSTIRRPNFEMNRQPEKSGPVFRHLGRLVCPEDGVDQFAGSSTGVHFTLSAQTKYQSAISSQESFPEAVFSLYLLTRYSTEDYMTGIMVQLPRTPLSNMFPLARSHYYGEIEAFFETWSTLYPILARKQFFEGVERIFSAAGSHQNDLDSGDKIILYQLLIILATVNCGDLGGNDVSRRYYTYSVDLYHHITTIGNLASLQALLLLLVYHQATAQHHLVYNTIGAVVRTAQSLGLHRHARRFRFCVGETEIRKRLWWCVYIFDVMTSLHYGLPKIINNEDDDNDLPIECDFDDITLTQLPLPFPGEPTRMSPFLCYIKMAKILSSVLKELYTTTRRRNGTQKIEQLTRELQVWQSLSEPTIGRFYDIEQEFDQEGGNEGRETISLWLHLLGQMALIYIHRPALTFESHEPQFQASIRVCSEASSKVVSLLQMVRGDGKLFRLFPSGPNLIFQCALLCLYRIWHNMPNSAESVSNTSSWHEEQHIKLGLIIEAASNLLDELHHAGYSQSNIAQSDSRLKTPPLAQASWVLRHLANTTTQRIKAATAASPQSAISPTSDSYSASNPYVARSNSSRSQHGSHGASSFEPLHFNPESLLPQATISQQSNQSAVNGSIGTDFTPDFLFGGDGNGLGYLNQMDESTWTFLSQMGGYSGEVAGINYN